VALVFLQVLIDSQRNFMRALLDSTAILESSHDINEIMQLLAELMVPLIADFCFIDLPDKNGNIHRVAWRHQDPAEHRIFNDKYIKPLGMTSPSEMSVAMRTVLEEGKSALVPINKEWTDEVAISPQDLPLIKSDTVGSVLVTPLLARGKAVGAITLCYSSARTHTDMEVHLAEEIASKAAIAITNLELLSDLQAEKSQRIHAEVELKEAEDQFRRVMELSPHPMFVYRGDVIVFATESAAELLLATSAQELIGKQIMDIIHPDYHHIERQRLSQLSVGIALSHVDEIFVDVVGNPVHVEVSAVPFKINGLVYIQVTVRNMTATKVLEASLRHSANHDVLTQLPNRRSLEKKIDLALLSADKSMLSVALLFIDIDNFKEINDAYGHAAGDELLQKVASEIELCLSADDMVARLGGDEYVVLMTNLYRPNDVIRVANKIIKAVEVPIKLEHQKVKVTISIGASVYPSPTKNGLNLLKDADTALYQSKSRGGNTFTAML
jgi:diguanylate cyclase (GGDEF)-like protein/PAS domain S-box-containing protein